MKAFKSISVFTVLVVPLIIVGYQNCSNVASISLNSPGAADLNSYHPIAFSSATSIGYSIGSCSPTPIEPIEYYSDSLHICVAASNSCEASYLEAQGFKFDDSGSSCAGATSEDSSDLDGSFKDVTATELGYKADPNQMCTMQFERLVSTKRRECVNGANGCEISYLKRELGFSSDPAEICN